MPQQVEAIDWVKEQVAAIEPSKQWLYLRLSLGMDRMLTDIKLLLELTAKFEDKESLESAAILMQLVKMKLAELEHEPA